MYCDLGYACDLGSEIFQAIRRVARSFDTRSFVTRSDSNKTETPKASQRPFYQRRPNVNFIWGDTNHFCASKKGSITNRLFSSSSKGCRGFPVATG